jgi:hypothetical protein
MLKMRKISYVLILALLLSFSSVACAFANDIVLTDEKGNVTADDVKYLGIQEVEDILAQPKQNITFIKGGYDDISHLEYTYSSAGRDFKVVEDTNDEYTFVDSTIYIKNQDGIYEKFATQRLNIDSSMVAVTFKTNGQTSTETFRLENPQNISLRSACIGDSPISLNSSYNGSPVTDWQYWGTFNYSNRIVKFTVAAVTSIIINAVSNSVFPGSAVIVSGVVGTIVIPIVENSIPTVYYTVTIYFKDVIPEQGTFQMHVAEKNIYKYYSNSSRTNKIGDTITTFNCLDGYVD